MTSEPKRIIELIGKNKFTYSFEVTPDVNIKETDSMDAEPVFISVTWHAKSHLCKDLDIQPLKTVSYLRSKNYQVLLHLTCDLMRKHYLERVLAFLQGKGVCNLFLVLGESYDPKSSDFKNTLELIKYIREISGQYFCIGVAGFCGCSEEQLFQLKEKVSAGADFVITQAFFEADVYKNFVKKCSKNDISVPILPGIFVYETYDQLVSFINMCKVKVSEDLLNYVKNYKEDSPGKEILKNMINILLSEVPSIHLHIFTLNKISNICKLIKEIQ